MSLSSMAMRSGIVSVRAALPAFRSATGGAAAVTSRRTMTSFTERERGEETVYMRKEDKRLLDNLLKKEKTISGKSRDDLMKILGDIKLPEPVVESLLHWKSH